MDTVTYGAAVAYVKQTANALGAVKGAPCTVKSITEGEEGSTIVFAWTGNDGVEQTGTTFIPRGIKGNKGDDGFSPDIKVTAINGGHRVTITDADGSQSFDVMDGVGGSGGAIEVDTTLTQEGKAADAKATGDRLNELSEEIGDLKENGGAGGATPDWNQNDETAPDYIKNRPFYEYESKERKTVYPITELEFGLDEFGYHSSYIPEYLDVDGGDQVVISWDGVEYKRTASGDQYAGVCVGNPTLAGAPEHMDTGEPFCIMFFLGDVSIYADKTVTTCKVGIFKTKTEVKKLDSKFIDGTMPMRVVITVERVQGETVRTADKPFEEIFSAVKKGVFVFALESDGNYWAFYPIREANAGNIVFYVYDWMAKGTRGYIIYDDNTVDVFTG